MSNACRPLDPECERAPTHVRRLGRAFEHSAAGMALLTPDGRLMAVNRAFATLLGCSRGDLVGRSFVAFTHADDVPESRTRLARLRAGEISNFGFDKRYVHRDGRIVWVHVDASMVLDAAGRPDFIITQARDITASRRVKEQLADREARLRSVIRAMGEGVVVVDADGRITLANERARELLGFDDAMLRWATVEEFARLCRLPDGRRCDGERFAVTRTLATGRPQRDVTLRLDRDGVEAWIELSTEPVPGTHDGDVLGVVATFSDITDRIRTQRALKQSEERLSLALEGAKLGMWDWNLQRREVRFNPMAERMLGYGHGEVPPSLESVRALAHPDDESMLVEVMECHLHDRCSFFDVDARMRRSSGTYLWTNIRGRVTERDPAGRPLRVTGMLMDISERKALEHQLECMAGTDELTGLNNRRRGTEALQEEIDRAARTQHPFSLVLLDIDRFKKVNDRFGHDVGDRVLREFADLLRARLRRTDIAARWGGEEFALVLPATGRAEAGRVAESLLGSMDEIRTPDGGGISASFGVVEWRPNDSASEMLKRADRQMYRAKQGGRARVEVEASATADG